MRITMARKKSDTFKVRRDAKTGKFIPVKQAERRKSTSVVETIKKKNKWFVWINAGEIGPQKANSGWPFQWETTQLRQVTFHSEDLPDLLNCEPSPAADLLCFRVSNSYRIHGTHRFSWDFYSWGYRIAVISVIFLQITPRLPQSPKSIKFSYIYQ